jgi:phosphoribosylglycinamide formyltransferase-1
VQHYVFSPVLLGLPGHQRNRTVHNCNPFPFVFLHHSNHRAKDDSKGRSRIKRLAVLASGRGSNLANIHRTILEGRLASAELALVVSNNSKSGAMEFAAANNIPNAHNSLLKSGNDVEQYNRDFADVLQSHNIDIIALAGYMKRLPDVIVERYANRILNVHPALLPMFGGAQMYGQFVHEAVLAAGCKVSGATVHLVTNEYDEGAIVLQKCCPVKDTDTVETLSRRVRNLEFELYPIAIDLLATDRIIVEGKRTRIK